MLCQNKRWPLFFVAFLNCSKHNYQLDQVLENFKFSFYFDGITLTPKCDIQVNTYCKGFFMSAFISSTSLANTTSSSLSVINLSLSCSAFLERGIAITRTRAFLRPWEAGLKPKAGGVCFPSVSTMAILGRPGNAYLNISSLAVFKALSIRVRPPIKATTSHSCQDFGGGLILTKWRSHLSLFTEVNQRGSAHVWCYVSALHCGLDYLLLCQKLSCHTTRGVHDKGYIY